MAKSAARAVVFTLKTTNDPKMKAAFDKLVADAKAAQTKIDEVMKPRGAGPKAVEEFAGKTLKEWERVSRGIDKELAGQAKATERHYAAEQKAWERHVKDKEQESTRFWTREAKRIDDGLRAEQRSMQQMERVYQTAVGKKMAAQRALSAGLIQTLGAAAQLGRGIAMLGLVGEKDLNKVKDTLLAVQGVMDLARGGLQLYKGLQQAVMSYEAAVKAAAVAETALGAARARSAAVGAAGAVGGAGAAGGAVGGAALGAALASPLGIAIAAALGSAAVVAAGKKLGHYLSGADNVTAATAERVRRQDLRGQDFDERMGRTASKRAVEMETEQRRAKNSGDFSGLERRVAADLTRARATQQVAEGPEGAEIGGHLQANMVEEANKRVLAGLEAQEKMEQSKLEKIKEQHRVALDRVKEELKGLEEQKTKLEEITKREREKLMSAAERFGEMDSATQQATIRAAERARAGETLTKEERKLARDTGLESLEGVAREQAIKAARAAGFDKVSAADEAAVSAKEKQLSEVKLSIDAKNEIKVNLEASHKGAADEIVEKIDKILVERDRELIKQIDIKFRRQQSEKTLKEAAERQAAGGGE